MLCSGFAVIPTLMTYNYVLQLTTRDYKINFSLYNGHQMVCLIYSSYIILDRFSLKYNGWF
jgi:hypothetical protein